MLGLLAYKLDWTSDVELNSKVHQLFNHFGNELKLLWGQMDAYNELFVVEPDKRQRLLHNTAPGAFAVIQVSLAESILMRVFRLMDPTKTGSNENSSIQHLHDLLSDCDEAQKQLRACIARVGSDWKRDDNNGPYAGLRAIRNKLLAHNDFSERAELGGDQLWMNLSVEDFESAQQLAGRLWALYTRCSVVLRGKVVAEPIHANLESRPAMLLKHLCASRYLDFLVTDKPEFISGLHLAEANEMGDDRIRRVFTSTDMALRGTGGDQK